MIRKREFRLLTDLDWSLLKELSISSKTHCWIVILRALVYAFGLLSLANGVFDSSLMLCLSLSKSNSTINTHTKYSHIGLTISNSFTCLLILADFYWSYQNRNFLQKIPSNSHTTFFFILLPLSAFPLMATILDIIGQEHPEQSPGSQLKIAWDVSCVCLRLLTPIFIASARYSCDTGEKLSQTLLRYAALIHAIVSMINLLSFDVWSQQIKSFSLAVLNSSATPSMIQPGSSLASLSKKFDFFGNKVGVIGCIVEIVMLLEPLSIQWNLVQQRLLSVKKPAAESDQVSEIGQTHTGYQWETVFNMLISILLSGSLLIINVLIRLKKMDNVANVTVTCVIFILGIVTALYYLFRMQYRTIPRHANHRPGSQSYVWFTTNGLIICIGLFSFFVQGIADLQGLIESCTDSLKCLNVRQIPSTIYVVLENLHSLTQGLLLLTLTQFDKKDWIISPKNILDRFLNPLQFLSFINAAFFVSDIINYSSFRNISGYKTMLSMCYQKINTGLSISGTILFRIHSSYVIIKFLYSNIFISK